MSRLTDAIKLVKEYRTGTNRPWIFDDDGNIKKGVICGDVLAVLEDLRPYEINVNDAWLDAFWDNSNIQRFNTYNNNANISNDLDVAYLETDDGVFLAIMVHLFGDVRAHYTGRFVVKFDNIYEFFELDSFCQSVEINDHLVADLNLLSETYNVYDYQSGCDVGEFWEIEVPDLLKAIKEMRA